VSTSATEMARVYSAATTGALVPSSLSQPAPAELATVTLEHRNLRSRSVSNSKVQLSGAASTPIGARPV
jgi:hypothetical protein